MTVRALDSISRNNSERASSIFRSHLLINASRDRSSSLCDRIGFGLVRKKPLDALLPQYPDKLDLEVWGDF